MDSKKLALLCRNLADNKKAEDLLVLDVRSISSITDYFVIASGSSEPHLRAIAEEITETLKDEDLFGADEAFLTSTTRELVPIVQVDHRTIGSGRPGAVTKRLLTAFRQRAGAPK